MRPPFGGRLQTAQTSCCRRARWAVEQAAQHAGIGRQAACWRRQRPLVARCARRWPPLCPPCPPLPTLPPCLDAPLPACLPGCLAHRLQVYILGRGNVKPADKRYSRVRNDYALHFDPACEMDSCGALRCAGHAVRAVLHAAMSCSALR